MTGLLLGLLKFGLSGLSVALFYLTFRLLQSEQRKAKVRPEMLMTIRLIMGLAVVLMIVPAGVEFWRIYISRPEYDATVREQVRSLATLQIDKDSYVLNSLPDNIAKRDLLGTILQVCNGTIELRKTVGLSNELGCIEIQNAYRHLVEMFPTH